MSSTALKYEIQNKLNPIVWDNENIIPEVKKKLIELGYYWLEENDLPESILRDMVLTGSSAGYNYNQYSDIDLHIIVNKDKIGCPKLVDDFLFDKKKIFAEKHDIKIEGHDVEVYAQDYREKFPKNESVYSLLQNKWIIRPTKEKVDLENPKLIKKVRYYKKLAKSLIKEKNMQKIVKFKEKLRKLRQSGLQRIGEYAIENIVYKELRNAKLLKKLDDTLNDIIDKRFSI